MHATTVTLLAYITLMVILLIIIGFVRTRLTLSGARAANSFDPSGTDVSLFSGRLCRAHANCYESFPIIGGLLLFAVATDLTSVTDGLAYYVLGARLLQTVVHVLSTGIFAVQLRFALFLAQISIAIWWLAAFANLYLA